MHSSHTANLQVRSFLIEACTAQISLDLAFGPLLSIEQLCDDGGTGKFSATDVVVKRDGKLRSPTTRLWYLDVNSPTTSADQAIAAPL
jgi:hypothetical protein